MKYLRLALDPGETMVHPVYEVLTGGECVEYARALHGNPADLAEEIITLLLYVRDDVERFTGALDGISEVLAYDVTPISDGEFYCYVHNETTAIDGALFAAFARESVVQLSPVEYHDDGRATFAVGGSAAALQDAMDDVPEGVELHVERVGDGTTDHQSIVGSLSERQREAAKTAVGLGYYDVPRQASNEDIADAMGCTPSTAAEHLRKAESSVFGELFSRIEPSSVNNSPASSRVPSRE